MNREDRDRATRSNKIARAGRSGTSEQNAATKAVLDNMARLKALRLAHEAAAPPQPATAKPARGKSPKKSDEKSPALADWLANQQNGGRRT
jgi:hypothetical protein